MIRRSGRSGLRREKAKKDSGKPTDNVPNMADAMLVLAVGIMVALVLNWNVEINSGPIQGTGIGDTVTGNITQIDDYEMMNEEDITKVTSAEGLKEAGSVYVDVDTGKMYIIVDEESDK